MMNSYEVKVVSQENFYYSQKKVRSIMRKLITGILMLHTVFFLWGGDISSLTQVFQLNHGLEDRDKDGFADHIALYLAVPEDAGSHFTAAAEDIAARANLESVAGDFNLVVMKPAPGRKGIPIRLKENPSLKSRQGKVELMQKNGRSQIQVSGGSPDSVLKTARAFFLRWPYLWDIWGREEGPTYFKVEDGVRKYLEESGIPIAPESITVVSCLYEFNPVKTAPPALKKLRFPEGELKEIQAEVHLHDPSALLKAEHALTELRRRHRRGQDTEILSYPGCAGLNLLLKGEKSVSQILIPRVGTPRRLLTPGYRPVSQPEYPEKTFDLLDWLTLRGILSDTNQDRIPDNITTTIVVPESTSDLSGLPSRLLLHSSGASFPLVRLDSEIEDPAELQSPVLIGNDNLWVEKLKKEGKLAAPGHKSGWACLQVVSAAFNKTSAVVLTGDDSASLSGLTRYLTDIYPYLQDYQKGRPKLEDVLSDWEDFLKGEKGAAESFFFIRLKEEIKALQGLELDSLKVRLDLPKKNPAFVRHIREKLESGLNIESLEIVSRTLDEGRTVFNKNRTIPWEGDEAVRIISQNLGKAAGSSHPVNVDLGISESPQVRNQLTKRVRSLLEKNGITAEKIRIGCSYKPGFFWIKEVILPRLKKHSAHRVEIQFAEIEPDFSRLKRFYSDPNRWLFELYPIDDIISREADIPLDRIVFEKVSSKNPVYQVEAYDSQGNSLLRESFSPPARKITYMPLLPEWGDAAATTGWVKMTQNQNALVEELLPGDLEKFWDFYRNDVLDEVYRYVKNKTGGHPTFSKQPYFKQLKIELRLSEPDFRLELDQERVSSLEAIHDEIYFDTLDFLRGITEKDPKEEDKEGSRSASAPGLVLPVIHPSLEGKGNGSINVLFEDDSSQDIRMRLEWEDKQGRTSHRSHRFPEIKPASIRMPLLIFDSRNSAVEKLVMETKIEKEKNYTFLIDVISAYRTLENNGIVPPAFSYAELHHAAALLQCKDLKKEEVFVSHPESETMVKHDSDPGAFKVPQHEIISPEQVLELTRALGKKPLIRTYIAGTSYEGRKIPVMEIFTPPNKYISTARLITFKPTLFCSGRQHANEISATNYILEFARRLAEDNDYSRYTSRINFILHPMENPDGAAAAYKLQKLTPEHSLHAGRYSSLGIDVGSQVYAADPLLPEAEVRKNLFKRWQPDIHLNLHGYPSHEWVQPFSGYVPFLFRDYWIPRGWFVYYRALSLPLFPDFKQAGDDLKKFIIDHLNKNPRIRESNRRLYDRYRRWAARWQPHLNRLEIQNGVNIYSQRRSSRESWLTPRRKVTFIQETPEVMDETATGEWLGFLIRQGLTYLKAHAEYLLNSQFQQVRVEEEINGRIRIRFFRRRPGRIPEENQP